MKRALTVRRGQRFRFLFQDVEDSAALQMLEAHLCLSCCRHKRVKVPRSNVVRLLVAKPDYGIAFRVMQEWASGAGIAAAPASASRSPVAGE